MKNIWVVVADSTMAHFYSYSKSDKTFDLIKTLSYPENRLKEIDLSTDRPGLYQKGSYEPPKHAREVGCEHFAQEICQAIENARVSNQCTDVIMIADSHFYGLIHKLAPHQLQKIIQCHLAKNYTRLSEKELQCQLKQTLSEVLKSIQRAAAIV